MNLTPKQEAFTLKYVECGNASEAYRHAYDVGEDTKLETIHVKASELLSYGKVAVRRSTGSWFGNVMKFDKSVT